MPKIANGIFAVFLAQLAIASIGTLIESRSEIKPVFAGLIPAALPTLFMVFFGGFGMAGLIMISLTIPQVLSFVLISKKAGLWPWLARPILAAAFSFGLLYLMPLINY